MLIKIVFTRDYTIISLLELTYMYRNQSQVLDLYAIFATTSQKENVVFTNCYFCWWRKA